MAGWDKTSKQLKPETEVEKPKTFSTADIEKEFNQPEPPPTSAVCCVFSGHDGTAKSGVCIDCRTKEEIKAGKRVVIIDLDGSAGPLKMKYFKGDNNIKIFDPIELLPSGEIDFITTYNKVLAIVKYIRENEQELNLAAVVLDGLNTLLKTCEFVMRYETLKIDPDAQIHDRFNWGIRNRRYLVPIILIKRLHCKRFFTTHLKELRQYSGGQLMHIGWAPDWEKSTPGVMFQRVELSRKEVQGNVIFEANVKKAKGALQLEGSTYTVAEVISDKDPKKTKVTWYGLKDTLYAELEKQQ